MATREQDTLKKLRQSAKIRSALEFLRTDHARRIEEMKELALIFGETGKESLARSPRYREMLARDGAENCTMDSLGNVTGYVRGAENNKDRLVLFEAHLDTVFPEGTPLAIREENGLLYCPGIGDDAGGLALNLSLLRAIRHAGLVPVTTMMIAGTACEESTGNFNGMRKLCDEYPGIVASVSIDGGGNDRVCHQGVGNKRIEFVFRGPGGHSWGDYGIPMCMHAMCRAMSAIAALELSNDPKTIVNVGVIRGGDTAGAIASEVRVHVDMRSLDSLSLEALERDVIARVQAAVTMENTLRGKDIDLCVTVEAIAYADIPAAASPADSCIVQTAVAAGNMLKIKADTTITASTNANIPMSRSIPAVTLGYGGTGRGVHSLNESFDPTNGHLAAQKALLVLFALAGLEGEVAPLV